MEIKFREKKSKTSREKFSTTDHLVNSFLVYPVNRTQFPPLFSKFHEIFICTATGWTCPVDMGGQQFEKVPRPGEPCAYDL